ncbi:MAG TPA: O-antigen ligase family protein [Gemmataceae bacterium]|nr:O-antigen ligase family protein [Gemmataceae bacterium]
MRFYLFVLLNAVLFVRPADIFPELDGAPIYEAVILSCLAVSAPAIVQLLTPRKLYAQPLILAMLGMLVAVIMSHLAHGRSGEAFEWGFRFFKIIAYFLLLVAVVDTPARLHHFVGWIAVLIVCMTGLSLLQYAGAIDLPSLAPIQQAEVDPETGETYQLPRLCGPGIFNDPNDLSVILVVGLMIGLYQLKSAGAARVFWAGSLVLLGYALTLTHSRGGFVALVCAVMALAAGRLGLRKAILFGGPAIIGLAVLFGGRQTNLDLSNSADTGQQRIRLWREGMVLLQQSPAFGIGAGRFEDEVGLVAHNSFVHSYAELGVLGGTLFLGAFVVPLAVLFRLRGTDRGRDRTLRDLRPFVLACVAGTAGGMVSLSRVYTLTPYLVLGMVTVVLGLTSPSAAHRLPRLSPRLIVLLLGLSVLFIALTHVFVRLFAGTG